MIPWRPPIHLTAFETLNPNRIKFLYLAPFKLLVDENKQCSESCDRQRNLGQMKSKFERRRLNPPPPESLINALTTALIVTLWASMWSDSQVVPVLRSTSHESDDNTWIELAP